MSFEVIKWVYNKTFVEIMKNTVHFRNFEKYSELLHLFFLHHLFSSSSSFFLNKSDVKIGEDERFLIGATLF